MNHRIATLAALAIIGSTTLGLKALAVSHFARGATEWIGSPEVQAVGRAGRIAATSLGRTAADHARGIAFDATLGVVRGLSAVYAATGTRERVIPAVAPEPRIRIRRESESVDASAAERAEHDSGCESTRGDRTTS